MKKTGNYQLNLWEKSDRIQMEDFNADNMKTEQALGALQAELSQRVAALRSEIEAAKAENPWRKLASVTLNTDQQEIAISMSNVDLTKYHKLEIYITPGTLTSNHATAARLQVNGTSGYIANTSFISFDGGTISLLRFRVYLGQLVSGAGDSLYKSNGAGQSIFGTTALFSTFTPAQVNSLYVFGVSGAGGNTVKPLPAGTTIQIYGLMK